MKIAVLDSDVAQLETICPVLNTAGFNALAFHSEKELFHHLLAGHVDMLIVDANATNNFGTIKEKLPATFPILYITTRFAADEVVAALSAGAFDYLIKPVRRNELLTRVQVLLQRAYPEQFISEKRVFGRYVIESKSGRIALSGSYIELTKKEFELAWLLFRHVDQPLSRAYLLNTLWSHEPDIPSRTLDTHISRVRTKLQLCQENGFRLVPVYGFGYKLEQMQTR